MAFNDFSQTREDYLEAQELIQEANELPDPVYASPVYEPEGGLYCPNCGNPATFSLHFADSIEPHGERHSDEWLTCNVCGERTDEEEVSKHQQLRLVLPKVPGLTPLFVCGKNAGVNGREQSVPRKPAASERRGAEGRSKA
jgi:hypothetical protein